MSYLITWANKCCFLSSYVTPELHRKKQRWSWRSLKDHLLHAFKSKQSRNKRSTMSTQAIGDDEYTGHLHKNTHLQA